MSAGSLLPGELPSVGGRHRARGASVDSVVAGVAALTLLGAALRFYGLGHQGFWFDEANTVALVRLSPGKMLGLIPQTESTPPLYYCVAWVWSRVLGDGEAGLRSLSALAGVLLIPVAYGAATELHSRRAGVICAALTACSPLLIWYSQEARSYASLALLTGLALLAFVRARADPSTGNFGLWAITATLALATHYFAAVVIVPQAVWLAIAHRHRRPAQVTVAIVTACGLALIPLAISQNGTGNDSWIGHTPLAPRLAQILPQYLIGTDAPDRQLVKLLAFALALMALAGLAWGVAAAVRGRGEAPRGALVAGALALAGFAIGLTLIAFGFDDLITRNLIELWLPAAIVIAVALASLRDRGAVLGRFGAAIAVALCAIGIFAAVAVAVTPRLQRPDWPGVARVFGAQPPPGHARAILIQHYSTLLPLSLSLPGLRRLRGPTRVTELYVIAVRSPGQPLCWWGAECNLISSRMQRRYPIRGLRTVWVRRVREFSIMKLVARTPVSLSRARVAAALTTTSLPRDALIVQRR